MIPLCKNKALAGISPTNFSIYCISILDTTKMFLVLEHFPKQGNPKEESMATQYPKDNAPTPSLSFYMPADRLVILGHGKDMLIKIIVFHLPSTFLSNFFKFNFESNNILSLNWRGFRWGWLRKALGDSQKKPADQRVGLKGFVTQRPAPVQWW